MVGQAHLERSDIEVTDGQKTEATSVYEHGTIATGSYLLQRQVHGEDADIEAELLTPRDGPQKQLLVVRGREESRLSSSCGEELRYVGEWDHVAGGQEGVEEDVELRTSVVGSSITNLSFSCHCCWLVSVDERKKISLAETDSNRN